MACAYQSKITYQYVSLLTPNRVLAEVFELLSKPEAIAKEGLFRVSGSMARINQIKVQITPLSTAVVLVRFWRHGLTAVIA